jgi:hypothetical protein
LGLREHGRGGKNQEAWESMIKKWEERRGKQKANEMKKMPHAKKREAEEERNGKEKEKECEDTEYRKGKWRRHRA